MPVTKALIIDEPWISRILQGEKVWEMRSTAAAHRGLFGLIRKGSGQVVGVANLVDVSGPHDNGALADNIAKHLVGPELFERDDYKWRYAWELQQVQLLQSPVNYIHKNGAVTWVRLNTEASDEISRQLAGDAPKESIVPKSLIAESEPLKTEGNEASEASIRILLTQGNVNNYYFHIPKQITLFSRATWGGKNKKEAGSAVRFHFDGLNDPVSTDIDGTKRILRNRTAVKRFYELNKLCAGDEVQIKRVASNEFRVSGIKKRS